MTTESDDGMPSEKRNDGGTSKDTGDDKICHPASPSSSSSAAAAAGAAATAPNANIATTTSKDSESSNRMTMMEALQMVETLTNVYGFTYDAANEAVNNVGSGSGGNGCTIQSCCDYILDNGLGYDTGGAIAPIMDCPHVIDQIVITGSPSPSSSSPQQEKQRDDEEPSSPTTTTTTLEAIPDDVFDRPCNFYATHSQTTDATTNITTTTNAAAGGGGAKEQQDENGMCPKGENWLCLTCCNVFCSRYVNGHGVRHWEQSRTATTTINDATAVAVDAASHHGHCVMISLADLSVWCHVCNSYIIHEELLQPIVEKLQHLKFSK